MKLSVCIKPFSANQAYQINSRNKQIFLTPNAKSWINSFLSKIQKYQADLKKFHNEFNFKEHSIKLNIDIIYPRDIYFTKEGVLSSRAYDIDNPLKLLIDSLFNEKYYDRIINREQIFNIGIDDKHITRLNIKKKSGKEYQIKLNIQRIKKENLK